MIHWAPLHPQLVHFVIALGLVGVALRLVSLTGQAAWTRPSGAVLLIVTAIVSIAAVRSGTAAHGPVERIPGAGEAVERHEESGETTRNIFLAVGALELLGLALASRPRVRRWVLLASALTGVVAAYQVYVTGQEGGELVYAYAGGPGLRSGNPTDVRRLLIAGLYAQAAAARDSGHVEEAARLTDELVRQMPEDRSVALLSIRSQIQDRHDPAAALAALDSLPLGSDNPRWEMQLGLARSEALTAAGRADSAHAVLIALARKYPQSRMLQRALERAGQ